MHRIKESAERARRCRHLNFLISETFDLAEKHCEAALGTAHTPFVMVVKDNFAVRGVRMTCASKMLREFVPPYTATTVQRLLKNGGCLLGKSNMDEFAMGSTSSTGCFGPVLHAMYATDADADGGMAGGAGGVDDFRIAGGSSGGCAVAVATGVADVAIGSDTGGSVRYPAALNGVYGFKPSYGRLSRHGLVPLNNALDTPSIFARTAEQCRTYFEILRGHDPMDATSLPDDVVADKQPTKRAEAALDDGTLIIGIPEFDHSHFVSDDALRVWHAAIEQLERAVGARTRAVRMPNWEACIQCYATLTDLDVASNMARYDGIQFGHNDAIDDGTSSFTEQITASRTAMLGQNVKRRIFAGTFYGLQQNFERFVGQAARVRRLIQRDFQRAFEQCDVLLTPCSRHSAPLLSETVRRSRTEQHRMDDFFLIPANLCGVPAISVPFAHCAEGRPLGVQLIGPYLADDFLLQVAALLVPLPTDHTANLHTN
uniref:Amidase domain-containing protein n=1 Tax=Globodera rostochiensis TaxID=31243 RepID=A0A914I9B6_GLORO